MNSLKILLLIVLCHTATSFLANGVSFRNIGSLGMMKNSNSNSKNNYGSSWSITGANSNNVRNIPMTMADPDAPPEVDPTRRDPDEPDPEIPVRLPTVDFGGTKMDVNSRLLKDRIIMVGKQVDDEMANVIVSQLLYLANEDPEADITMYINSPGGSISSGMAIFDTMQFIPCDVQTVCFGMAASMGAFLLGAGTKGKRRSLPNARIMIHQPLGGARGQAADIEIQAKEILFVRAQINAFIAAFTDQPIEKIEEDCDRDFYMTAEQAVEYGLIDDVVKTKTDHIKKPPMPQFL